MNLRKLFLPFSLLYDLITRARNFLYDKKILSSKRFDVPVICVGNLNTGGTGKTPHVEYLIELLKSKFTVATLSRGYGRSTSGFLIAKPFSNAAILGDEPYQYFLKHPEITVTVGENRTAAIEKIISKYPNIDVVLMDDGLQHRAVNPGLKILLTEYSNLFTRENLLPAGNLRESKNNYMRSNIIIVTKCPEINQQEKQTIIDEISPLAHQTILFSHLKYDALISFYTNERMRLEDLKDVHVLCVTGIANPAPFLSFLKTKTSGLSHLQFKDHHDFSTRDLQSIQQNFDNIAAAKKIIVTTEKDFARLKKEELKKHTSKLPLYYLPVKVTFDENDKKTVDDKILNYVGQN